MRKFLKYTGRGIALLIGVVIILYTIAYIYVTVNRKEIITKVTEEISEKLNGTVALGSVDLSFFTSFPQVAVLFTNVSIRDSLYSRHNHTFFEAQKFYANISLLNLVTGKEPLNGLRINNGSLYVYTDTSGYTTSYLFTLRKKIGDTIPKPNGNGNVLKYIKLHNFRFVLDNETKKKLYDIEVLNAQCNIKTNDSLVTFRVDKKSIIHSLAFNLAKGSYAKETSLEGEFDLVFNKYKRQLAFDDIKLELKGHPFTFSGEFNFAGGRAYQLKIATKEINYAFAKTLVTPKIAKSISVVNVEKPVNVIASISGVLAPGEPLVNVQWKVRSNNIQSKFFDVVNASFTGGYTNQMVPEGERDDGNSGIYIHGFTGIWEGLNVRSDTATIYNLVNPLVKCDLHSDFDLTTLNQLLESKSIKMNGGKAKLNITYQGPLHENSNRNTFLNGTFSFSDGNVLYAPRNISMKNSSGKILFKNTDVFVSNFKTSIQENHLTMNGSARNLLSLIKTNPGKIALNWSVYSPALDLQSFVALLKKRDKVVIAAAPNKGKLTRVASQVDNMLNQANVKLDVKANKISFKKFVATDVNAAINMVDEDWLLNNVSFRHANGTMRLTGQLKEQDSRQYAAAVNIFMKDVDVNKVFYAFNNFEQDGIRGENIRGKLSTNVVVSMNMDRELGSNPTNLEGFIDFSLKDGSLIDFEPIQKLQNFLFKNRNFEQIHFAELKNRIEIKGREFHINRMEIQSTALTLFVKGVYSLDGNTDLSIQVPLSNLKKRGGDFKPENIGADAKAGPSIFVRGRPGEDGNIKFKLDLFNKVRKRLKGDGR